MLEQAPKSNANVRVENVKYETNTNVQQDAIHPSNGKALGKKRKCERSGSKSERSGWKEEIQEAIKGHFQCPEVALVLHRIEKWYNGEVRKLPSQASPTDNKTE